MNRRDWLKAAAISPLLYEGKFFLDPVENQIRKSLKKYRLDWTDEEVLALKKEAHQVFKEHCEKAKINGPNIDRETLRDWLLQNLDKYLKLEGKDHAYKQRTQGIQDLFWPEGLTSDL